MRYWELSEGKWWDDEPTITLYHGTSSALVSHIREHGLRPPKDDLLEYALDILADYIPREEWTDELVRNVSEHAARMQYGRSGDRGAVLYFFANPGNADGYAQSYAQHGGEIAYDVYNSACMFRSDPDISYREFKANPPLQPRWEDGKPVVVTVEVPKSWCIFTHDLPEMKANVIRAREEGRRWANDGSLADVLNEIFDSREIRIARTIPPEMIRSIDEVAPKSLSERVEMMGFSDKQIRMWVNPRTVELQLALLRTKYGILRGQIGRDGKAYLWDGAEAEHAEFTRLTGVDMDYAWSFYLARDLDTLKSEADWSTGYLLRSEQGAFYVLADVNSKTTFTRYFGPLESLGRYGEDS